MGESSSLGVSTLLSLTAILLSQVNTVLSTTLAYTDRAPEALAAMVAWLGPDAEAAVRLVERDGVPVAPLHRVGRVNGGQSR